MYNFLRVQQPLRTINTQTQFHGNFFQHLWTDREDGEVKDRDSM